MFFINNEMFVSVVIMSTLWASRLFLSVVGNQIVLPSSPAGQDNGGVHSNRALSSTESSVIRPRVTEASLQNSIPVSLDEESEPISQRPSVRYDDNSALESIQHNPTTASIHNNVLGEVDDDDDDHPVMPSQPSLLTSRRPSVHNLVTQSSSMNFDNLGDLSRLHQLLERRRNRQRRVQTIRQIILRTTGRGTTGHNNRPQNNRNTRREALAAFNRYNTIHPGLLPQRRTESHCYNAACSLPKSTDMSLWSNQSEPFLRLFFNVPRLNRRGDPEQKQLDRARLKLFVNPSIECNCPDGSPGSTPDALLVTVYQFIRPLSYRKRNRVLYRRQMLDSIRIGGAGNVWISLDVKQAVRLWMNRLRRNFGLEVTVSRMNGSLLDAKQILSAPSCEGATERSCREDRNQRIEIVRWPSMTLGEDTGPYLEVVTGERIQRQTFNRTLPSFHLRTTRSVSPTLAKDRFKSKMISQLMQKRPDPKQDLRNYLMQTINSKKIKAFQDQKNDSKFLRKVRQDLPQNCICDQKRESHNKIHTSSRQAHSNRPMTSRGVQNHIPVTSRPVHNNIPMTSRHNYVPEACSGQEISVDIDDAEVLTPRSYTTLQCPETCPVCTRGKCRLHTCQPARHHQDLEVLVRTSSGGVASRILPDVHIVTSCGCGVKNLRKKLDLRRRLP